MKVKSSGSLPKSIHNKPTYRGVSNGAPFLTIRNTIMEHGIKKFIQTQSILKNSGLGLSPVALKVLYAVSKHDGLELREICKIAKVSNSAASKYTAHMSAYGFIRREGLHSRGKPHKSYITNFGRQLMIALDGLMEDTND